MTTMIEVKTAELVGPALDWAVGIADGWEADRPQDGQLRKTRCGVTQCVLVGAQRLCPEGYRYSPSTDWSQGGPLIEKYLVGFGLYPNAFFACTGLNDDAGAAHGPTHLIAACRAIVASKLGDVVQVPAESVRGGEA